MEAPRAARLSGLAAEMAASLLFALLVMWGDGGTVRADEPSAERAPAATDAAIRRWIDELDSNEYAVRERATSALIRAGSAAQSQLREAAESVDLETQLRARRTLAIVLETAREQQITAFENDADGSGNATLPGWERARPRLGESAELRKLFGEMYRSESSLFAEYERGGKAAAAAFEKRVRFLSEARSPRSAAARNHRYRWSNRVLRHSVRALLLVGSDPEVAVSTNIVQVFDQLLQQTLPAQSLKGSLADNPLRAWIGDWIEHRSTDATLQMRHLQLGMMYGIERTLPLARRVLREDASDVHRKRDAILCIAKFGGIGDAHILEPLLVNEARLRTSQRRENNRKVNIESQVRDVALAALVRITQQDPSDYGMIKQSAAEPFPFVPNAFFFTDDAAREKALAKWKVWRAKHPIAAPE